MTSSTSGPTPSGRSSAPACSCYPGQGRAAAEVIAALAWLAPTPRRRRAGGAFELIHRASGACVPDELEEGKASHRNRLRLRRGRRVTRRKATAQWHRAGGRTDSPRGGHRRATMPSAAAQAMLDPPRARPGAQEATGGQAHSPRCLTARSIRSSGARTASVAVHDRSHRDEGRRRRQGVRRETAVTARKAAYSIQGIGIWEDPAESEEHIAWADGLPEAMAPSTAAGAAARVLERGRRGRRATHLRPEVQAPPTPQDGLRSGQCLSEQRERPSADRDFVARRRFGRRTPG